MTRPLHSLARLQKILFAFGITLALSAPSWSGTAEAIEAIREKYHLDVVVPTQTITVSWTGYKDKLQIESPPKDQIEYYLPLTLNEINLYPSGFFTRLNVKRVVIGSSLSVGGRTCGGYYDPINNVIYVSSYATTTSPIFVRKQLHHEVFHFIDARDDNSVADPGWGALNPSSVKYGNSGWDYKRDPNSTILINDKQLFVLTDYSLTALREDKAEMFGYLMADPAHVDDRCHASSIIAAKVRYMKLLVQKFYPEMDLAFWQKITQTRSTDTPQGAK